LALTAAYVKQDQTFRDRIVPMLQHADFGIDEVNVSEEPFRLDVPPETPDNLKQFYRAFDSAYREVFGDETSKLNVQMIHRVLGSDVREPFNLEQEESSGTQRFFSLIGLFLDTLSSGAVGVVDELDCSMHPLLVRKLIELFQSPERNTKGAQLIFATHDITLMDPELFRRDQIWLVEKNRNGASEVFSLHDFDAKDTETFQRNYLAGRYGGVPKFGPMLG
jgi:hypothetical protein